MYIATFYTHFGAVNFTRVLSKHGQKGVMMPVPRILSASCGVCVGFENNDGIDIEACDDLQEIYYKNGENDYKLIFSRE